jgi:hypothetical protein
MTNELLIKMTKNTTGKWEKRMGREMLMKPNSFKWPACICTGVMVIFTERRGEKDGCQQGHLDRTNIIKYIDWPWPLAWTKQNQY